jgi:hypothetical protein
MPESSDIPQPQGPPPRAFTQGVGTVYQFCGVILFLVMMFVCCGSALLSKDRAEAKDLTTIGWHLAGDAADRPTFSAQRAIAIAVPAGVAMGLAVAAVGLGLQAQNRASPYWATIVTGIGLLLWTTETVFAIAAMKSLSVAAIGLLLTLVFAILFVLAVGALREMRRDPPPIGLEILPAGYKVPYSHMHEDPPEVRLARELEQRRQRLAVQQKELEMLETRLQHKLDQAKLRSELTSDDSKSSEDNR